MRLRATGDPRLIVVVVVKATIKTRKINIFRYDKNWKRLKILSFLPTCLNLRHSQVSHPYKGQKYLTVHDVIFGPLLTDGRCSEAALRHED